jgi:hypothetical protein
MTVTPLKKSEPVCTPGLDWVPPHRNSLGIRESATIILTNFVRAFLWLHSLSEVLIGHTSCIDTAKRGKVEKV